MFRDLLQNEKPNLKLRKGFSSEKSNLIVY